MTDEAQETTEYTIKKVNTGLLGDHVQEVLTVDDKDYKAGDTVALTETAYKSLKDAGVKFESQTSEDDEEPDSPDSPTDDTQPEPPRFP